MKRRFVPLPTYPHTPSTDPETVVWVNPYHVIEIYPYGSNECLVRYTDGCKLHVLLSASEVQDLLTSLVYV